MALGQEIYRDTARRIRRVRRERAYCGSELGKRAAFFKHQAGSVSSIHRPVPYDRLPKAVREGWEQWGNPKAANRKRLEEEAKNG